MVSRAEDRAIHMRTYDAAELSHGVCKSNADARSHGTFERSDAFRPYDGICGASAGYGDDQGQVFDHVVVNGYENDVTDDDRAFDCQTVSDEDNRVTWCFGERD